MGRKTSMGKTQSKSDPLNLYYVTGT